ncbi:hypothetical protein L0P88_12475 [Muricauda sp. SCSIO 64092]|uniref:hypothetical protein n=1 Tax=Allomuricauda sp. SCSIO 64092 TaxID=2908842 RepID=UPI001FF59C8C|nr:hypothetical protein [Muricauda sp. SCSIO 64092]UOY04773.1 hypothetical protein L0P88_12475 [Muricauda sp. SCSIO 64092]
MGKINVIAPVVSSFLLSNLAMANIEFKNGGPTMDERAEAKLLSSIEYIEEEEVIDLGFDVHQYLPLDFDPYKGMIYDVEDIQYIELDEELEM